jgi:hypothetical protein
MPILGTIASSTRQGLAPVDDGAMFPLGMVQVGSGGAANVTFSSIPSTYKHLQIRGISRGTSGSFDQIYAQINSDTGANYANHALYGDGSSAGVLAGANNTSFSIGANTGSTQPTGAFGAIVIDILDYANTSKFKTIRALSGANGNTTQGYAWFASGLWRSTSAITSIKLERLLSGSNNPLVQYSQFALYGIKG